MKHLGQTKFCLGLQLKPSHWKFSASICLCPKSIREIQYG